MKKLLLFLSATTFIFMSTAKAQVINAQADDFEVWSPDPGNATARDPNNGSSQDQWQCLNVFSSPLLGSNPVSVFQDSTIVHSGKYACKIVSVVLNPTSYNYVKAFIPHDTMGLVLCGTIISSPTPSIKLGVPHQWRPSSYNFFYQYAPATNGITLKPDTAFCSVVVSHFSGGKRNTLGAGILKMNSAAGWTSGTVNITYDSATGNGDTLTILISSSSFYKPLPGSILYIDGSTVLGVNDLTAPEAHVDVYPNPASTQVNFHISSINGDQGYSIAVCDLTGKKIDAYPVKNNFAEVNTNTYSPGLYFYTLYDKNGSQMKMGKFCVVK